MRDKYWAMYTDLKFKERYYCRYQTHVKRLNGALNGFCIIISASSIAGWSIWNQFPLLWGLLLAMAQIIQAIKSLLPFSRQEIALRFLIPELRKLVNDIDHEWDSVTRLDETEKQACDMISDKVCQRYHELYTLEHKYIGDTYFPISKHCEKAAAKDYERYFSHIYNVE